MYDKLQNVRREERRPSETKETFHEICSRELFKRL